MRPLPFIRLAIACAAKVFTSGFPATSASSLDSSSLSPIFFLLLSFYVILLYGGNYAVIPILFAFVVLSNVFMTGAFCLVI